MKNNIEKRLKNLFESIFEVNVENIADDSSPETIPNWDSLQHMNLITAIEEEFEIYFDDDEIFEIDEFSKLFDSIVIKLNK